MGEIFKEKEEMEEFFKNLGIEYRFSCYHEKNGEGCHLLGDYMSIIENDPKRSAKVYKDNCDNNGFGRSCTQFGVSLLLGRGVTKELKKSVQYFTRGCQLNDNEGCFYAGQLLAGIDPEYKQEVEPDMKTALECLEKGCASEKNTVLSAECCFYAHNQYLFGKNGAPKDLKKAFKLALRGCELEHLESCINLSQMYALGVGTDVDHQLANKYKMKTIDKMEQIRKYSHIDFERT